MLTKHYNYVLLMLLSRAMSTALEKCQFTVFGERAGCLCDFLNGTVDCVDHFMANDFGGSYGSGGAVVNGGSVGCHSPASVGGYFLLGVFGECPQLIGFCNVGSKVACCRVDSCLECDNYVRGCSLMLTTTSLATTTTSSSSAATEATTSTKTSTLTSRPTTIATIREPTASATTEKPVMLRTTSTATAMSLSSATTKPVSSTLTLTSNPTTSMTSVREFSATAEKPVTLQPFVSRPTSNEMMTSFVPTTSKSPTITLKTYSTTVSTNDKRQASTKSSASSHLFASDEMTSDMSLLAIIGVGIGATLLVLLIVVISIYGLRRQRMSATSSSIVAFNSKRPQAKPLEAQYGQTSLVD